MNRSVLISGAGIGGPTLAFWLARYGYAVTVVEQASQLRASGSAVDFRGDQLALLERMGILDDLRACESHMGDLKIVDGTGKHVSTLPAMLFSGELEIDRGDLAQILYHHTKDHTEYVFGDRITALTQHEHGVDVTFERSAPRTFGLVIGADGLHSAVRRLAFGDEAQFKTDLGYYAASFSVPNTFGLDHSGWIYNEPNRYVNLSSGRDTRRAIATFVFGTEPVAYNRRDPQQQMRIVAEHYSGAGWMVPQLLAAMGNATDLYFDSLSQIKLESWSRGRVAVLGDAAWSAGPGGNGTGHAMLGAYTLAGELAAAGGDFQAGFARYEEIMRPIMDKSQKFAAGAGKFLVPPTDGKIRSRNRTYRILSSKLMTGVFTKMAKKNADTGDLKDYSVSAAA
ncbi:FAD-dependent monooxygenase [Fodinicola feengrottensis]|uniref:FAD-dependent monooxygenase n=2 Tax=Fodinicola feengrottensis TaxID=435914 RepID=A0ABN2HVA1_9ACTN